MAWSGWKRYWPWWIALGWLAGYELAALASQQGWIPHLPTLSELVWQAYATAPQLPWIVVTIVLILLVHFFRPRRPRRR